MHSIIPIYQVYLLAELNYKRFMYKKLCILLIFSKLKVTKLFVCTTYMQYSQNY